MINYHREIVFLSQIQSQNKIPFNGVSAVAKTLLLLACLLMVFVRNVPVMSDVVGVPSVAKTHAVANLSFMSLLPLLLIMILTLSLSIFSWLYRSLSPSCCSSLCYCWVFCYLSITNNEIVQKSKSETKKFAFFCTFKVCGFIALTRRLTMNVFRPRQYVNLVTVSSIQGNLRAAEPILSVL